MSLIEIHDAGIGDDHVPALATFNASLDDDGPAFAVAEGERGPLLASLVASGRLRPDRGTVRFDDGDDLKAMRRAVALVDTPMVAEAPPAMRVGAVVQEELRYASRSGRKREARSVLDGLDLGSWFRAPMIDLPPTDRIRLLLHLAGLRDGVRALVLTSPERHGGHAAEWRALVTASPLPVLVIGGAAVVESRSTTPEAVGAPQ